MDLSNQREELQQIADELRAIAAYGLNFARNTHDQERYQAVLSASARLSGLLQDANPQELLHLYGQTAFQLSAMPSAEAVVINHDQILLVRRRDDDLWALPGGVTDPGETLAQSAQRELWEETGIRADPVRLLGIFDSRLWQSAKKVHFYHALFLMGTQEKTPQISSEITDAGYFAEDGLPPLSPGHHRRVPFIFKQLRNEAPVPFFDHIGTTGDFGGTPPIEDEMHEY